MNQNRIYSVIPSIMAVDITARKFASASAVRPSLLCAALLLLTMGVAAAGEPSAVGSVSFRNDVMVVLSKAGCNAGACHGNKNGKGGFKLSLRGDDPDADYSALVRDMLGRRINLVEPEESLFLLKPATDVAHEGGNRLKKGSDEYDLLRRWIAAGAKDDRDRAPKLTRIEVSPREKFVGVADKVQIKATAYFDGGAPRDITRAAVYEANNTLPDIAPTGLVQAKSPGETTVIVRYLNQQTPVTLAFLPEDPAFKWSNPPTSNFIDEQVFAKLQKLRLNPSPLASDEVFLRRAYLDLLGILPTRAEAEAFG